MITVDQLRSCLRYDHDTGNFIWLVQRTGHSKIGNIAGRTNNTGYRQISLNGRKYSSHRLAWLYVHGEWPSGEIDHINGCKTDNRLVNLRLATRSQNQANNSRPLRNGSGRKSGRKGVVWHRRSDKWQAQIGVQGKLIYLGLFNDVEAASNAYAEAATQFFGEFARS